MIIRITAPEKAALKMRDKIAHMIESGGGITRNYTEPHVPKLIIGRNETLIIVDPTNRREPHGNEAKG